MEDFQLWNDTRGGNGTYDRRWVIKRKDESRMHITVTHAARTRPGSVTEARKCRYVRNPMHLLSNQGQWWF